MHKHTNPDYSAESYSEEEIELLEREIYELSSDVERPQSLSNIEIMDFTYHGMCSECPCLHFTNRESR